MSSLARSLLKRTAFSLLGSRPVIAAKLRAIHNAGAVTILNLHRVGPPDRSTYPPLSPRLFDYLLRFVRHHFDVVTLDDLSDKPVGDRPRLVLSFDDGYADFFHHALPLLEKHGLRANHNVIPECIETGQPPLNVIMADYVGQAPDEDLRRLQVPGLDARFPAMARAAFGNALAAFLRSKPIAEQRLLGEALVPQVRRSKGFKPTAMMSLDQVKQAARTQDIGAHSFSHASLGLESDDYLRDDLIRCKDWFAAKLSAPVTTYAFPNGSYRGEQVDVVRSAGVKHILLVEEAFSTAGTNVHKRFNFDAASRAEVRFRATGSLRWPTAAA